MLYLIQDSYKDENNNYHDILKIGYAKNIDSRLTQYNTHNYGYTLLKEREGDEDLEKHLHSYFNRYRLGNTEWFEYDKEIVDLFDTITLTTPLPIESITYDPRVFSKTSSNLKDKKNPELIHLFRCIFKLLRTKNNEVDEILKEELEKLDIKLYNKCHISKYEELYDYLINQVNERVNKIKEEQKRLSSLLSSFSFVHTNPILVEEIDNQYSFIEKDKFINDVILQSITSTDKDLIIIDQFVQEFNRDKNFERRIKLYCSFLEGNSKYLSKISNDPRIPRDYSLYCSIIGPKKIKAVGYHESELRNLIDQALKKDEIAGYILHTFLVGNKYSKKFIKEELQKIYNQNSIKKTAKVGDIENYFETKRARIPTGLAGKYDEGLEILSLK